MSFINPIWLWGLSGLAIPVSIHLLSRKEGPIIQVGSIRFLTETSTSKFSSIRLNEIALLAVRSLLIICLTLFLAGLLSPTFSSQLTTKWVVVENGLERNQKLKPVLDSLHQEGYESKVLEQGFPSIARDTTAHPDYYTLGEQLAKEPVSAIVLARNTLVNFKGKRAALPENVRWIAWPEEADNEGQTPAIPTLNPVQVTVVYDQSFTHDKKILLAALAAIQTTFTGKLSIREMPVENFTPTDTSHWLIRLSEKPVSYPGMQIRFQEDAHSKLVVQESKSHWLLTKRLTEDNAIEQHLAIQLMNVLFGDQYPARLIAAQRLAIPNELAWSNATTSGRLTTAEAGTPLNELFLLAAALLFIAERILAFYRKQ